MIIKFAIILSAVLFISCNTNSGKRTDTINSGVRIAGAMKNVMMKGELSGIIDLDTIQYKNGLYGLGPIEYLTGELLIIDGKSYVSKVLADSTMFVTRTFKIKAPFFVYSNVENWKEEVLPDNILTIDHLEEYIDNKTSELIRPFTFKLIGSIESAIIHITNLPKGTKVNSPEDAHQGQTSYEILNKTVTIVGYFSTEHKGIFTHHDSYLHMHLITTDKEQMGHLDNMTFEKGKVKLYFPKE